MPAESWRLLAQERLFFIATQCNAGWVGGLGAFAIVVDAGARHTAMLGAFVI